MRAIVRTITGDGRGAEPVTIWPIGDTHVGAAACDEKALARDVARVAADPNAYWVSMGDVCDFITRHDPRFETDELAAWIRVSDLRDLVTAQRDRFLDITRPIWPKCLAIVSGNHEGSILRYYERAIDREIVGAIQPYTPEPSMPLSIGYEGYLRLRFERVVKARTGTPPMVKLDAYLAHGYGGGKLMGAKALNLGREAGWHAVDLIVMGHTHTPIAFPAWCRWIDRRGNIRLRRITTCVSGTYNLDPGYARRAGYAPNGYAVPRVIVSPWSEAGLDDPEAVRVVV